MVTLRPYQEEAKSAILNEWAAGNKRTLLKLPTGCGKTIVFASVADERVKQGGRELVLAHRNTLLNQAADKIRDVVGLECSFEKGTMSTLGSDAPITISSVQTMSKDIRLLKFPPDYFTDIIVDEAHHCLSKTYQKVFNHFPSANVLGVTATPNRSDMKSLGEFFNSKAYDYSLAQAIQDGYLSRIRAKMVPVEMDIKKVTINNGDYAPGEIDRALDPYLDAVATQMESLCKDRRTVVFLPLIETSKKFVRILRKHKIKACEVNGKTKNPEKVISNFENGKYSVICNAMLLTEGWDCPSIDCVIILRPTQSRTLYQQMVGRGTRLYPGKKELLLLDFLWQTDNPGLCRPSALIEKDDERKSRINALIEKAKETGKGIDLIEAEAQVERDIVQEREWALAAELERLRFQKEKEIDPIQFALSIEADDLASYSPVFKWEKEPVTEKQLEYLKRKGFAIAGIDTKGKACAIIDTLIKRQNNGFSTPKQIRFLERKGFHHVGLWSFEDASAMIENIRLNYWSVPNHVDPETYFPGTV